MQFRQTNCSIPIPVRRPPPLRILLWVVRDWSMQRGLIDTTIKGKTILAHPSSETDFIVHEINYLDQIMSINDTKNCLIKWYNEMGLLFSPFSYLHDFGHYIFLNCSPQAEQVIRIQPSLALVMTTTRSLLWQAERPTSLAIWSLICSVILAVMIPIEPRNHEDPPNPSEWSWNQNHEGKLDGCQMSLW